MLLVAAKNSKNYNRFSLPPPRTNISESHDVVVVLYVVPCIYYTYIFHYPFSRSFNLSLL